MNIGETIRNFRLQRSMSQGDIEKRTGLLRCYLSRVENGHTPVPRHARQNCRSHGSALSQFFSEGSNSNGHKGLPQLSDDEVRFLSQMRRYAVNLNDSDRKLVLAMVKKMANTRNSFQLSAQPSAVSLVKPHSPETTLSSRSLSLRDNNSAQVTSGPQSRIRFY